MRVIIGPADIRFELWFNNQKLSRDQSIRVEWIPAPSPVPQTPVDLSTYNRVELPDSHPTHMSGGLVGMNGWGPMNGHVMGGHVIQGVDRTGTNIETGNGEEKKGWRGIKNPGGLLGRARGGKWPVYG